MNARARLGLVALAGAAVLVAPAQAWAHAYLTSTSPAASTTIDRPPAQLSLTYDEAVEPRFMIVSVTDANGKQETAGRPRRSPANPDTIVTPLERVPEGWYLVFWRAISVDGHPVRGAFTFAVGPNPGPPPQFVIPSLSESAATPGLLTFRWLVFLSFMAGIGLLVLRTVIARPLGARVPGMPLRWLSLSFVIACAVALLANPIYIEIASAQYAFKSAFDVAGVVPLWRSSAFGRAWLDFEAVFALFAVAGAIAIWLDRADRRRSVAGLLSVSGALVAAAAVLLVPGLAGHAAQASPHGLSLALDWFHLAAGSIWIGGLIGLLVLWWSLGEEHRVAGLGVCVPRFSRVAFVSVVVLVASGIGASLIHFPTFSSLWQTSYGTALIAKIGLLFTAMALASGNLLRTRPRLQAAAASNPSRGTGAARLLRGLVSGEVVVITGALFAASILSSLPPPPKALASLGHPSARVGPGAATAVVTHGPYRIVFHISPNKAVQPNAFTASITKNGKPVHGAQVTADFAMLDMEMPQQTYGLAQRKPGVFRRSANALVMVGHWGLTFTITPPGGQPFDVVILDHATG